MGVYVHDPPVGSPFLPIIIPISDVSARHINIILIAIHVI